MRQVATQTGRLDEYLEKEVLTRPDHSRHPMLGAHFPKLTSPACYGSNVGTNKVGTPTDLLRVDEESRKRMSPVS